MTLERLTEVEEEIIRLKQFADKCRGDFTYPLGNHQILPIYQMAENGLRRALLAYATASGKSNIPIQLIRQLWEKGEKIKALVVAPLQAIQENWDEQLLRSNGITANIHRITDQSDLVIPSNADIVVINYHKITENGAYLERILNFSEKIGLLVADEAHNVKNKNGQWSKGMQKIVEACKGTERNPGRYLGLTATPCPNEPKDLGIQLYMLDPFRYGHYARHPFVYGQDWRAIAEMKEAGRILFFNREDVRKFHNLPEFIERDPINVSFLPEYEEEYFEHYTRSGKKMGEAYFALERTSINAMIHSPEFSDWCEQKLRNGHMLNFFSHLVNDKKSSDKDLAIFASLEKVVRKAGRRVGKNIVVEAIHGNVSGEKRREIQERCATGEVDVLINQTKCTSEGFSEVAGQKPVSIVPLRPFFEPGVQEQVSGRSYRPGQYGRVEFQDMHPDSDKLKTRLYKWVMERARKDNLKMREGWFITLFAKDCTEIRKCKEIKNNEVLHRPPYVMSDELRSSINDEDPRLYISSLAAYHKWLSSSRTVDTTGNSETFGNGTREAMKHVGIEFEQGLKKYIYSMAKDYDRHDILIHTPGIINNFLAQYIGEKIKKDREIPLFIADLGCDSSAPFAQARMIRQLENGDKGLDFIVCVDGTGGCIARAKEYIEEKKWLKVITPENFYGMSSEKAADIRRKLKSAKFNNLEFKVKNFVTENYGDDYDVIITSQSLQYNNQSENRDIEKILIRINHSLRQGGHYLAALTQNKCGSSCTSPEDANNFLDLLNKYEFRVELEDEPYGVVEGSRVTQPFYFVHAVKVGESVDEPHRTQTIVPMYSREVVVLSGGTRNEKIASEKKKKTESKRAIPRTYVGVNGDKIL